MYFRKANYTTDGASLYWGAQCTHIHTHTHSGNLSYPICLLACFWYVGWNQRTFVSFCPLLMQFNTLRKKTAIYPVLHTLAYGCSRLTAVALHDTRDLLVYPPFCSESRTNFALSAPTLIFLWQCEDLPTMEWTLRFFYSKTLFFP